MGLGLVLFLILLFLKCVFIVFFLVRERRRFSGRAVRGTGPGGRHTIFLSAVFKYQIPENSKAQKKTLRKKKKIARESDHSHQFLYGEKWLIFSVGL